MTTSELEFLEKRLSTMPDYRRFKKAVRSLRDLGWRIQPLDLQGYRLQSPDDHIYIVMYPYSARPALEHETQALPRLSPSEGHIRKGRSSKPVKAAHAVSREAALRWLESLELPVELNPIPDGKTIHMSFDLMRLAEAHGDASGSEIHELLADVMSHHFPGSTIENTRLVLMSQSPSGVQHPVPLLGIKRLSEAETDEDETAEAAATSGYYTRALGALLNR